MLQHIGIIPQQRQLFAIRRNFGFQFLKLLFKENLSNPRLSFINQKCLKEFSNRSAKKLLRKTVLKSHQRFPRRISLKFLSKDALNKKQTMTPNSTKFFKESP